MEKSGPIDLIKINRFSFFLALLFGNELPQHPQQAGIIDPYCDVASIVRGNEL